MARAKEKAKTIFLVLALVTAGAVAIAWTALLVYGVVQGFSALF